MKTELQQRIDELEEYKKIEFKAKTLTHCSCCGQKIPDELYQKRLKIERENFEHTKHSNIIWMYAKISQMKLHINS